MRVHGSLANDICCFAAKNPKRKPAPSEQPTIRASETHRLTTPPYTPHTYTSPLTLALAPSSAYRLSHYYPHIAHDHMQVFPN